MKIEIYHNYKSLKIREIVYKTKSIIDGMNWMNLYQNNYLQSKDQYHEFMIDGKVIGWESLKKEYGRHINTNRGRY